MPQGRTFKIHEYVRWSDVDAAGIVCYGAFVRFVEVAETELFRAAGMPYSRVFDEFNCWLPRVHFSANFHEPARLDERLEFAASVRKLGTTSLTLAFTVENERRKRIADFEIVLVCIDRRTFAKRELPKPLREALSAFAA
jgi:YbgC/YbaW family acyl-CoA thioester hydrolase